MSGSSVSHPTTKETGAGSSDATTPVSAGKQSRSSGCRATWQAFVSAMGQAIGSIPSALAGYRIDSIGINAEISASGKVSLLGNGGEVTGTGGITFKLTRVAGSSGASAES